MELVIATHNMNKLREFREIFKLIKINTYDLLSLTNFPKYSLPPETGNTFLENALLKARHAATHLKKWVIADDSGLVVPMLKGEPGVNSAYYAGENATDLDNRHKLLQAMQHLTGIERAAYFECCLVLCGPDGFEKCVTGKCEGLVLNEERGRNGFGYDSLFIKYDYDKTFAEIDESVKNKISHRYKAMEKLKVTLETLKIT